jgi:hypothetical protein
MADPGSSAPADRAVRRLSATSTSDTAHRVQAAIVVGGQPDRRPSDAPGVKDP